MSVRHSGCSCPPEFYGPHCEFLLSNIKEKKPSHVSEPNIRTGRKADFPATTVLVAAMGVTLVVLAALLRFKRHNLIGEESSFTCDETQRIISFHDHEKGENFSRDNLFARSHNGRLNHYSGSFNDEFISTSGASSRQETIELD